MDINMKNVKLGKKDNWVVIAEEFNPDGSISKGTKLLYDDNNNYAITDKEDPLEQDFANMSNDNLVTAIDDIMTKQSFITDWFLSVSGGKAAKAGLTVAENGVERDVVVDKFIMDLMQDAQEKLLFSGLEGII